MQTLQARLQGAEKRTILMENRLLLALSEQKTKERPQNVQLGCSWPLFVFVVCVLFGLIIMVGRQGALGSRGAPLSSGFPMMVATNNNSTSSPVILSNSVGMPTTFVG